MDDARRVDAAFWKNKPLQGRQITSADVLAAYGNDKTSLRSGFFLQNLCLQNRLLGNKKVVPEQVIQEFNRAPDRNNKCKLAIARFKAECCLKALPLRDQQVIPDAVVKDFPDTPEGKLGIARFKEHCCLKGLPLRGQPVTPDAVVRDYQAARAKLELARFKEQCCLRSLPLRGRQVTTDEVVREFPDSPEGKLGIARFKMECCLRGLLLNGYLVSPDAVVRDYQAARATQELARFTEQCCLKGLSLNGQLVTPDMVIKGFPASPEGKLAVARFKADCCLRGLALNDLLLTPDEVVKDYQSARAPLELARFKAECCLRGLPLNDQQITTEVVVRDYQAIKATLELARFKAECCLRGLPLHGRQVTQDSVVRDYQIAKATLEEARFRAECCLRGLALNGHPVTPDSVVKSFPDSPEGKLGIALFKTKCCLRGITLNGQLVTPDLVVKSFPDSPEGKLGTALFKSKCCLRGLTLDGQLVTPEAVLKGYPDSPEGKLGVLRFKAECCLKGRQLHGHLVTPESVVEGYKRGGWLLENAIFCTQLALNGRELNGNYLDNQDVLEAFNEVPGDHTARQAEYLIQKLQQPQRYDETSEAQDIIQKAWQILNSVSLKDEHPRLRCVVQFLAMRNELTIDHQGVSAEQVLCSIRLLRQSFLNSRIHFFFLAHCYITSLPVHGRPINKNQVLRCLQNFPEGSKLHHALGCWFEQRSCEANLMDELLFKRQNPVRHNHRYPLPDVIPDTENSGQRTAWAESASAAQTLKQESETDSQGFPDNQVSRVNGLTLKTLGIIQEINGSYRNPPILITGSYARFLQNLCSSFNDIDIICTTEDSARTLFKKLQGLNSDGDAEIPRNIIIWPVPGCQAIKLPNAFNVQLKDGDLGTKAMALQVSVDHRVTHGNAGPLAADVPGVEGPVWCLSFDEETRLLNDTLEYLATNLDPLTEQLQKGTVFDLPRTILFNSPQNTGERIYGLLMRSLLTLNKARQFIALYTGKPTNQPGQEQQRLHALAENLQMKLGSHAWRDDFEHQVNSWLSTTQPENDRQSKKKEFIKTLLAMMHTE